jgi:hypothetical protein
MAGVYFQIRAEALADAVQCGLKLSEHADRELILPGEAKARRVMSACLHPEDFPKSRQGSEYRILRLDLDPARCHVGDADLYRMGRQHPALMQLFLKTLVLLRDYRFGTFREPECLVTNSVLDTQIEVAGHAIGFPVVFENSAALYLRNRMGSYDETLRDGGNALFFAWCRLLESKGHLERYPDEAGEKEVFLSKRTGEILVLTVPDHTEAVAWP